MKGEVLGLVDLIGMCVGPRSLSVDETMYWFVWAGQTDIAHTTVKHFLAMGALQAGAVKTSHREDMVWRCV